MKKTNTFKKLLLLQKNWQLYIYATKHI